MTTPIVRHVWRVESFTLGTDSELMFVVSNPNDFQWGATVAADGSWTVRGQNNAIPESWEYHAIMGTVAHYLLMRCFGGD